MNDKKTLVMPLWIALLIMALMNCSGEKAPAKRPMASGVFDAGLTSRLQYRHAIILDEQQYRLGEIVAGTSFVSKLSGDIFLLDKSNFRYLRFDRSGRFKRAVGAKGKGPGELTRPWHLTEDNQGYIYVFDESRFAVVVYDSSGKYLKESVFEKGSASPGDIYASDRARIVSFFVNKGDHFYQNIDFFHFLDEDLRIIRSVNISYPELYARYDLFLYSIIRSAADSTRLYVSFPACSEIHQYNYDGQFINILKPRAAHFNTVNHKIPRNTDIAFQIQNFIAKYSFSGGIYPFRQGYLFFFYFNTELPPEETRLIDLRPYRKYYYDVVTTEGGQLLAKDPLLPGEPLYCSEDGKVYLLINNLPNHREIAVYEIILEAK